MPPEISQIEEERRADFNRSMLQSERENKENDDELTTQKEQELATQQVFYDNGGWFYGRASNFIGMGDYRSFY